MSDSVAMQMARIIYPNQKIVEAEVLEDGTLQIILELDKPVNYISFTTEVIDGPKQHITTGNSE